MVTPTCAQRMIWNWVRHVMRVIDRLFSFSQQAFFFAIALCDDADVKIVQYCSVSQLVLLLLLLEAPDIDMSNSHVSILLWCVSYVIGD